MQMSGVQRAVLVLKQILKVQSEIILRSITCSKRANLAAIDILNKARQKIICS